MNKRIANFLNYLAAIILLAFGLTYLLKNSFMPYHSKAVSMEWSEVEAGIQALILALMRAVSGGYIAASVVIAILQNRFASTKLPWIPLLILVTGLIVSFTSIYATIIVRLNSPGKPPTFAAILGIVLLLAGYIFNLRRLKKN